MFTFSLLLTIYAGFTHAFEADHLLAVSNIVSKRNNIKLSLKDGIFWGLGHASIIFILGILVIVFKAGISQNYFQYFESIVGFMLMILGAFRLVKFFCAKEVIIHSHSCEHAGRDHAHLHVHLSAGNNAGNRKHPHSLAYGVGLVHGLAGSGALILIVISQMKEPGEGMFYLLTFAAGCIAGMMMAAGFFSIAFSKKLVKAKALQSSFIIISSLLCLLYGGKIIYENLLS